MLPNVKQATIAPLLKASIVPGTLIYNEYIIYSPLSQWGYDHKSVCHGRESMHARRMDSAKSMSILWRLLVVAVLVQTTPRYFSREVASISGQLHRLFTTLENEVKHYFSSSSMSPQVDPWNPLRAFSDSDTSVASQQVRSSLGTDASHDRLLVSTLTGFGSIAATAQQQPRERG